VKHRTLLVSRLTAASLASVIAAINVISAGCASFGHGSAAEIAARVRATSDPYQKTIRFTGPPILVWGTPTAMIRAWETGHNSIFQIYVFHARSDWAFYSAAYDSNGTKLRFREIDRDVGGGSGRALVSETVGIDVTRDELESYAKAGGADIKLVGRRGSATFRVTPDYILGFLEGFDSRKKSSLLP
jgi:hypothetical protein